MGVKNWVVTSYINILLINLVKKIYKEKKGLNCDETRCLLV